MPRIEHLTMLHQRWTQRHVTDLRHRASEGETIAMIAGAIQRSPEDIQKMMAKLRLRPGMSP